jgi:hypothetical protein
MNGPFISIFEMKGPFIPLAAAFCRWCPDDGRMALSGITRLEPYLRKHSRYGVISAETLERLGVPQTTTYRRCLPGGRWTHLLPGIVLLSKAHTTARQRVEAALMHANGVGAITGFEAARRYGLKDVPAGQTVHVLIPAARKVITANFALIERTISMPEIRLVEGVPLAAPARAVLDGIRRVREIDPVRALLIECLERGLCTHDQLSAELEVGSKRGTALPRAVLRELAEDVRSVPEAETIALWKRAGLPSPERNVKIFDNAGKYIAMPDTWCDEVAMAWEIDSWAYHLRGYYYAKTLERNNRYAAAGIVVVQTLPNQLRNEPKEVVTQLRAAYAAAKQRPRPSIAVSRNATA